MATPTMTANAINQASLTRSERTSIGGILRLIAEQATLGDKPGRHQRLDVIVAGIANQGDRATERLHRREALERNQHHASKAVGGLAIDGGRAPQDKRAGARRDDRATMGDRVREGLSEAILHFELHGIRGWIFDRGRKPPQGLF